ncbi:glycosyl transferase family 2 [Candidatus Moduliflexus flocculans]|uniref:Glycosyl transferase family 2 n=1 Tax=Candidatus Moduliflexus flocculans TaxID=1499966 RepID=A0A081BLZ0_9BACT|nr:glycosyl transferase family 2 [Candidatus Moduliflexus flocculans]
MEFSNHVAACRPELYRFDQNQPRPAWQIFTDVAITTVTFNRLEHTKRLINSLYHKTQMPFTLYVFDQASDDGTAEYLGELRRIRNNVIIIRFPKNIGKARAFLHAQSEVRGDLFVHFDNDIEILSNYWLVHLLKAYYAYFLGTGACEVALGLRMLNQEEYGFRYATTIVNYRIPSAQNALPRTSYSSTSHDSQEREYLLDERVCLGLTHFLCGGAWSIPLTYFRRINWKDFYPIGIGGDDQFISQECARLGIQLAYIENGPLCYHHDWPYSDEKLELYARLKQERMVTDWPYLKWKAKDVMRRWLRR